jgi:hypothetical protein
VGVYLGGGSSDNPSAHGDLLCSFNNLIYSFIDRISSFISDTNMSTSSIVSTSPAFLVSVSCFSMTTA